MAWGYHTLIDLYDCDPDIIRDKDAIIDYVIKLCELIKMTRYGECVCVRFGKDPGVTGYSFFQLIEESNISGHFIEITNCACIDIFSCKLYDVDKAINFTKKYFKAKKIKYTHTLRLEDNSDDRD